MLESSENLISSDLQIDSYAQAQLSETAKWAKFIAVAGFIFSGFLLVFDLYYISLMNKIGNTFSSSRATGSMMLTIVSCCAIIIIWVIVSILQLKFANKLKLALDTGDQDLLNAGFLNLKIYYRLSGAVAIISLLLFSLSMIGLVSNLQH